MRGNDFLQASAQKSFGVELMGLRFTFDIYWAITVGLIFT